MKLPAILFVAAIAAAPALAQCPLPDPNESFYVPQTGPVATPAEGAPAIRFFRACPNNDGGSSLPNHARIKIVLRDAAGLPLPGVPEFQVYTLYNGGTPAQGFSGPGADSIISNGTWNPTPLCPDVRVTKSDAPTDASGTTYITFGGGNPASPGSYLRDSGIKWGHFDTEIPVFVGQLPCNPIQLKGRLTTGSAPGTYVLRIKNVDVVGGLGAILNQGERVTVNDLNTCVGCTGAAGGMFCYWCDFDWSTAVNAVDLNILTAHINHSCQMPLSP